MDGQGGAMKARVDHNGGLQAGTRQGRARLGRMGQDRVRTCGMS